MYKFFARSYEAIFTSNVRNKWVTQNCSDTMLQKDDIERSRVML